MPEPARSEGAGLAPPGPRISWSCGTPFRSTTAMRRITVPRRGTAGLDLDPWNRPSGIAPNEVAALRAFAFKDGISEQRTNVTFCHTLLGIAGLEHMF